MYARFMRNATFDIVKMFLGSSQFVFRIYQIPIEHTVYIEVSNDFDIPRLLEAALLPRRQFFRITNIPMDKSLKLQDLREEITWL